MTLKSRKSVDDLWVLPATARGGEESLVTSVKSKECIAVSYQIVMLLRSCRLFCIFWTNVDISFTAHCTLSQGLYKDKGNGHKDHSNSKQQFLDHIELFREFEYTTLSLEGKLCECAGVGAWVWKGTSECLSVRVSRWACESIGKRASELVRVRVSW